MTRLRWPIAVLLWLLPALALSQSTTPGGTGSGGGGATGSVTPAGTNGSQGQAVQGIDGGVPVRTTPGVADAVTTIFTITGTGPTAGVSLKDYGSVLVELFGTFSATVTAQVSTNSTDGVNGDWTTAFGYAPESSAPQPGSTLTAAVLRREYKATDGAWLRLNATAYTSGTVTALVQRRTSTFGERLQWIGGGTISATARSAGTNRSATVGTTAVALWPADTSRQGGWVKNDTSTTLWCNFDGTATATAGGGNFQVAANGGAYTTEPGFVSTNALSCISTASIAVTSRTH